MSFVGHLLAAGVKSHRHRQPDAEHAR